MFYCWLPAKEVSVGIYVSRCNDYSPFILDGIGGDEI